MNIRKPTTIKPITIALTIPLVFMLYAAGVVQSQASQKSSDELLLEIMDLHSELVTNETFLAQAKMLGAYLEAAQLLEEAKKIKIYAKVLNILSKIKTSPIKIKEIAAEPESVAGQKPLEEEKQEAKSIYEPGAALLEIFRFDLKTGEHLDLPIIRTYWKRDLSYSGEFVVPDRRSELGNSPYVAKFSFYYEAIQSGRYGFTVVHNRQNGCGIKIGGVEIVSSLPNETSAQGVCNLEKGFHRFEFGLGSGLPSFVYATPVHNASFQVKVLIPGAFDAVPLTKDMMLLKKE